MKDKMSITTKRIRKLIDSSGKTRKELSTELGCDVSTIAKHYNCEREVNTEFIVKYADYFDVSADYLLGREKRKNEKELQHIISDYLGLSELAIKELRECISTEYYSDLVPDYQNLWIMESMPDFKDVLNRIIESGCIRKVIGLISDYYRSMEMATDVCNDLLKPLEEINSHNRVSGTDNITIYEPLELLEILTEQKEIRLHYYEIQECLKSFVNHYREKTIKAYSDKTKEFNTVYNEYERLTRQEGEARGNNQETQ